MPHSLSAQLGLLIFLPIVCLSLVKGGRVERIAAAALCIQLAIVSVMVHQPGFLHRYGPPAVDVGVLAVLLALAFRFDRRWTLWAAAFQLLAVLTNFARLMDPSLHRWAYMTTAIIWGYGVLDALAFGTIQVMLRRRKSRGGGATVGRSVPV